jgi:ferric-dicitrate binding protein FerR (iron transport regulator)
VSNTCAEFQGLIAAAIYGPLSAADQARLRSHLAGCNGCRQEQAELQETAHRIGQSKEATDLQGDAFLAAVKRKLGAKTHRRLPLNKPVVRRPIGPALAAAAVLVAAILMYFVVRPKPASPIEVATNPPIPVVAPDSRPKPPEPEQKRPSILFPAPAPAPKPEPPIPPVEKPAPVPEPPKPEPEPIPVPPPPKTTVAVMATIESAGGEVAVQTDAGKIAAKADLGLIPGQELQTGSRSSHVVVKVTDGTRIHLAGDTVLRLVDAHNFQLSRGALRAEVAKQAPTTPMIFATPTADARVLGTELFLFAGAESTRLEVRTGKVRLTRREDGASADVSAGQTATAPKTGAFAAKPGRAATGLQALYLFQEGQGNVVHDLAASGAPLDLRILKGRAPWTASGLQLEGNPMLRSESPATRIFDACRKTQELTLEAWVVPAKAELPFEGAILSLSTDVQDRNFALSQNTSAYDGAVRLSTTDGGGRPVLTTGKGAAETKLTHVVFTRDASGRERLYVNGVERTMRTRTGNFSSWSDKFHLFAANESFEERPWSGTLRLAAVYSQALTAPDVVRNFKAGVE